MAVQDIVRRGYGADVEAIVKRGYAYDPISAVGITRTISFGIRKTAPASASIDTSIAANADDCQWNSFGTFWNNLDTNSIGTSGGALHHNAQRFTNVTIPQGATITAAYLTVVASTSQGTATVNGTIYAEDVDNATQIASAADAEGRTLTTASTAWSNIPAMTAGTAYQTPDISAVIQEVVNRAGWVSGNALQIITRDTGSTNGAYRHLASIEHTTYAQFALHVEYGMLRPIDWDVRAPVGITRNASWGVRAPIAQTRTLTYAVSLRVGITRETRFSQNYNVTTAKTLLWDVDPVAGVASTSKSVAWSVRTTIGITRAVSYRITTPVPVVTRSLSYQVGALVSQTRSVTWSTRAAVARTRILSYHVGALATQTRTLVYHVGARATRTRTLLWQVSGQVTTIGITRNARWSVRRTAIRGRQLVWNVRRHATRTRTLVWKTTGYAHLDRPVRFNTSIVAPRLERAIFWVALQEAGIDREIIYGIDLQLVIPAIVTLSDSRLTAIVLTDERATTIVLSDERAAVTELVDLLYR